MLQPDLRRLDVGLGFFELDARSQSGVVTTQASAAQRRRPRTRQCSGSGVDPTELVRTFTSPQRAPRMNGYLSTCGAAPYWPPIPDAWSEEIVSAISSVVTIALA
jgi:hypothetical protein